jgi:hypothetical protein
MGSQKHTWRHGISDNIAGQGKVGEAKAKLVMEKLVMEKLAAKKVRKPRALRVPLAVESLWRT